MANLDAWKTPREVKEILAYMNEGIESWDWT